MAKGACLLKKLWPVCIGIAAALGLWSAGAAPGFSPERMDDRIQNTACEVGPDGHLYVVSMNYHGRTGSAQLTRYLLDPDGRPTGEKEVVHDWGAESPAQPIGLAFDPEATEDSLVAWIALGESLQGHSGWSDPWAGRIYRARLPVSGASGPARLELKITNLPHAFHTVNDITFGPDDRLYICVGSATTLGWEPHMTEQLLSGAILQADVRRIEGVLDVKTADGGRYNPFAPDAPVRLHGTAIRQPYDSVWHPNGRLYACTNQNDVNGRTGAGGGIPDVRDARPPEFLAIIERGKTYGFPNAARGEFVLMGGNPAAGDDGWTEIDRYPVGIEPPPTFDPDLLHRIDDIGGYSANGIIAYRAGGSLQDRLITCFYSTDRIFTFTLGDDGRVVAREPLRDDEGEPLRLRNPLDLCEHPTRGHLYVAAYGKQDKGEGGAVYFLERTEPLPPAPALRVTPTVVHGETRAEAADWSGTFRVRSTVDRRQDYRVTTSADWLRVSPASGHLTAAGETRRHRLRLKRVPGAGTHYAEATVKTGETLVQSVSVHLNVASAAEQKQFAVSAGNAREVTTGDFPVTLPVQGTVMSAAERTAVEIRWELESGDREAIRLSDPELLTTTAVIQRPGRYVLRLVSNWGEESREARTTYRVDVPDNQPPGLEITANEESIRVGDTIELTATGRDDGRPEAIGGLRYQWSREGTGSGIVEFSAPDEPVTLARFNEPGEYRLRCRVSDGVREAHRELTVSVTEEE